MGAPKSLTGMLKINFPGADPRSMPTLSEENVKRIPPKVSSLFTQLGQTLDLGDITILTIDDLKHRPTVLRAVQWLETGDYEPFSGTARLEVHKHHDEQPVPYTYDEDIHQLDTSFSSTADTRALFLEEAKLYAFGVLADFPELQRYSARKIMFHYPVYASEIMVFLEQLSRNKINSLTLIDPKMAEFLAKRLSCCRNSLLDTDSLLPLLRTVVDPKRHFQALLRHADQDSVNKGIAELKKAIKPEDELSALLDTFGGTKAAVSAASSQDSRLASTPSSRGQSRATESEHRTIFRALAERRLLVTGRDGYGTLRMTHNGEQLEARRNSLFRFQKGELLLRIPHDAYTVNGPNDLVVRNQLGEIGEVFKGLVFPTVQNFISRANSRSPGTGINTTTLPSPASIKSEASSTKRPNSGEDLFPGRLSRQRLQ